MSAPDVQGRCGGGTPEVFIVCGPTGAGKSEAAVQVAESLGGTEIVGVDAYQVYRGMEILSAAPTAGQRARVRHHLVGVADPARPMDAARYAAMARDVLADIHERGKRALIVGGSGLYLAAVFGDLAAAPPSDPALRRKLEAMPHAALLAELDRLDPVAAARIDRANPRRLIRAIEVCLLTGKKFSAMRSDWGGMEPAPPNYPPGVLLTADRDILAARIRARVEAMIEAGVLDEVRALDAGVGPTAAQAIGLGEFRRLIAGRLDLPACIEAVSARTRQYAKRQLTWFRNKTRFPEAPATAEAALSHLARALPEAPGSAGRI